jgi:hypothetical protein
MSRARPTATILRPILPSGQIVRTENNPRPLRTRAQSPGPTSGTTGTTGATGAIGSIGAIPFFRDPSHLGSTKGLYRSLLRAIRRHGELSGLDGLGELDELDARGIAESESRGAVRKGLETSGGSRSPTSLDGLTRRLRETWRKKAPLTSLPQTLVFLDTQQSLLSQLSSTTPASVAEIRSLSTRLSESYTRAAARSAKRMSIVPPKPRLTGGYLRPTLFNPPLPRLKPQPEGLSMMIHKRLRVRERRTWKRRVWAEWAGDMKAEMAFYRRINDMGPRQRGSGSGKGAAKSQMMIEGMSQLGDTNTDTRRGGATDADRSGTSEFDGEGKGKTSTSSTNSTTTTTTTTPTPTSNTNTRVTHDPWMGGWDREMNVLLWNMDEAFRKEGRMSGMKFKEGMVRRVERAKARRDAWRREEALRRKDAAAAADTTTSTSMGRSGSAASRT